MPSRRRKLLVASIGVATVSYVAIACRETPVSGNLPAPPPPTETPPVSGNLPAPPPPAEDAGPEAAMPPENAQGD